VGFGEQLFQRLFVLGLNSLFLQLVKFGGGAAGFKPLRGMDSGQIRSLRALIS
jgi:hypothetical protein